MSESKGFKIFLGILDLEDPILSPNHEVETATKPSKREGNGSSNQAVPTHANKPSRRTTSLLNLFMSNSQGTFIPILNCNLNPCYSYLVSGYPLNLNYFYSMKIGTHQVLPLHPFALRYKYLPHWLLLDLIVNNGINAIYGNYEILKIFRLVEVVVA